MTAPATGAQWVRGSTQTILWTSTGAVGDVQIQLKDGSSYSTIVSSTANDGSYSWAIPANGAIGSNFQIRVSDVNHWSTVYGLSGLFSLTSGATGTVTVTAPATGAQWVRGSTQTIRWTTTGTVGDVQIQLKDGSSYSTIIFSTSNDGSYSWTIPANGAIGSDFQVRVSDVNHWSTVYGLSGAFSLTSSGEGETIMLPGDVPLEMVWIPAGTFMMGRYPGEQDSYDYEDPQHEVTLSSGFWLGKYELSKAQWEAVMGTTPWSGQSYVLDDPNSPAVYVSWNDAQSFITALNGLTGKTFRLPSEAEWEYACRAGTSTRFYWGDDPSYTVGNAYCWWTYNAWDVGEQYAHVVGLKLPNAFGLHDMSGNVWEWCEDDWHWNYTGAPANGAAWADSPRGSSRVVRGGGWGDDGYYCPSARRFLYSPSGSSSDFGFRLAR